MPRLTQLDDILFAVEERPVFAGANTAAGELLLSVPNKRAIVDTKKHRVVGIVGRGYRLVTNRELTSFTNRAGLISTSFQLKEGQNHSLHSFASQIAIIACVR
jgi:hypothetical protein